MALPLMPKATAVWLVENTTLSFEQIASFCGMHSLEVQAIADGEVAVGIVGLDPVANGQLTREEIERWSGRQFDPQIVKVFLEMPDNIWEDLREDINRQNQNGQNPSFPKV